MQYHKTSAQCTPYKRATWESVYSNKYHRQWGAEYLALMPNTMAQRQCKYRNVTIIIQASTSIFEKSKEANWRELDGFALGEYRYFVLLMMRFGDFPITEYRITVLSGGHMRAENELGLLYPPTEMRHQLYEWGSKQAHELSRAWVGGGVIPFDPATPSFTTLDKGLNTLLANLVLHTNRIYDSTVECCEKIDYVRYQKEGKDMPLKDMMPYTDTRYEIVYYLKGEMLFLLLAEDMERQSPKSFCALMRRFYAERDSPPGLSVTRICEGVDSVAGASSGKRCRALMEQYYTGSADITKDPSLPAAYALARTQAMRQCDNSDA
jgi:hypothetical protein